MNADLHMAENLKNTGKGNLFVVFGEPDIDYMVLDLKEIEKVQIRTNRLFNKYKDEYNLNHSQTTGKVLYELENTFEGSPINELISYLALEKLNEGQSDVLAYLKSRKDECLYNLIEVTTIQEKKAVLNLNFYDIRSLERSLETNYFKNPFSSLFVTH
jgi:hypothetical protein